VVAFIVLRPSDDKPDSSRTSVETTPAATATVSPAPTVAGEEQTPTPTSTPTPEPTPDPGPLLTTAKVTKIRVKKGETVRFRARSSKDEEIHVHGYDLSRDVAPGKTARMSFKATIDGIFEIEFEHAGIEIAQLRVDP
jgi:heme/copper-type cytochrome/quinol oxidase subunit 2